jgi:excisionase family DNA binding protein
LHPRKPMAEAMTKAKETLTLPVWPDTGRALGLGRNATYEAVRRKEIPSIKIGKRILVPRAALERMLAGAEAA